MEKQDYSTKSIDNSVLYLLHILQAFSPSHPLQSNHHQSQRTHAIFFVLKA